MLFYPYDIKHYQHELRDFYFNYSDVPGPIVTNKNEFYNTLSEGIDNKLIFENFSDKYKFFRLKFCTWEKGYASKQLMSIFIKNG